ncbi:MAG: hypothetical protein U0T82_15635 [Bacteroidales bacterium]
MDCQFCNVCGFFQKYNASRNLVYRGFILRYCRGNEKEHCMRLDYQNYFGVYPADDIVPSGQFLQVW